MAMTSMTRKYMPIASLTIGVILTVLSAYGIDVPLEELMPLLVGLGLGGIPLAIAKRALEVKEATKAGIKAGVDEANKET